MKPRMVSNPAVLTGAGGLKAHDPVYQPAHYARYVIEPITFINANRLPFNIGNVIKYALRYDAKDGLQDLEKAKRYIDIEIECIRRREAGNTRHDWVDTL